MLLAVDVGNTNITFAIFKGKDIVHSFRMMTKTPRTSDEYYAMICELLFLGKIEKTEIHDAVIASVVPGIMHSLNKGISKVVGKMPMEVGAGIKTGLKLSTPNPKEIGADRVVDCLGAYELYGKKTPLLVADFGTATTYDLVMEDGTFNVGITCPGIRMSANALWNDTAKLPEIEIKLPDTILAQDTETSMQAGLMFGCIGQTEYIINRVKQEAGLKELFVVATGGLGRIISSATESINVYDPELTMKGLYFIFEKNKGRKRK